MAATHNDNNKRDRNAYEKGMATAKSNQEAMESYLKIGSDETIDANIRSQLMRCGTIEQVLRTMEESTTFEDVVNSLKLDTKVRSQMARCMTMMRIFKWVRGGEKPKRLVTINGGKMCEVDAVQKKVVRVPGGRTRKMSPTPMR